MTKFRLQYTQVKPGGHHVRQDDLIWGTLEDVRTYFDARRIWGADPIVVIEQILSDHPGRVVPASEWDI